MDLLGHFLKETPVWSWFLLAYLLWRGIKARRPAATSLVKLAVIPGLFAGWSLETLLRHYGLTVPSAPPWIIGLLTGAFLGSRLLSLDGLSVDYGTGIMVRPADKTLLPLLLATFAVKYVIGAALAIDSALAAQPGFSICDLVLSGGFTGIFAGKFYSYYRAHKMLLTRPVIPG